MQLDHGSLRKQDKETKMLKPYLNQIIAGHDLEALQAEEAMEIIMTGQATPAQIGGFLVALRMKGESVDEITGAARAMRRVVNRVNPNINGESPDRHRRYGWRWFTFLQYFDRGGICDCRCRPQSCKTWEPRRLLPVRFR